MKRLTVESERGAYSVIAKAGAVTRLGALIDEEGIELPRSVVSDTTVGPLWGVSAANSLGAPVICADLLNCDQGGAAFGEDGASERLR